MVKRMSSRKIKPALTFESDVHPLRRRQFCWVDQEGVSISLYAGKEMTISQNDNGTFQLSYLDMAHPDQFESMNAAKHASRSFAISVLVTMLKHIGIPLEDVDDPLFQAI